jgi:hypothetical protein
VRRIGSRLDLQSDARRGGRRTLRLRGWSRSDKGSNDFNKSAFPVHTSDFSLSLSFAHSSSSFSHICATAQGDLPNWRALAWVAAAASALLFVAMAGMPESPAHLVKAGRAD